MKKVYIFFIATKFKTGKAIRFFTGNRYNHVAFSFDRYGSTLYSYARYRYNEPMLSGFGIEYTDRYARPDFGVEIKVCEYDVSDSHYRRIKRKIKNYSLNRGKTMYNFFDIAGYPMGIHFNIKYVHTCLSFITELLEAKHIRTIGQLERKLRKNVIYRGRLDKYIDAESNGKIDFYEKRRHGVVFAETAKILYRLAAVFICGLFDGSIFFS